MPPKPRSAEYFGGWYADRVATPTVDEIMNRHMGFPPDTRAGVVPAEAIPELAEELRSSARNTAADIRLWVWYWIDSEQVRRWRRQRGAASDSGRVFGCALGYLGDPAAFIGWNIAGDLVPVVREVVDRARSGGDRIWNVVMNVPAFPGRVPDTDLTFFDPGQVVDLLAAHGCTDQIGSYLRRLGGGLQSTGTVRTDGSVILAAARRHLAGEAQTRHTVAAHLVDALNRAECSQLQGGLVSRVRLRFRRSLMHLRRRSGWLVLPGSHPGCRDRRARGDHGTASIC